MELWGHRPYVPQGTLETDFPLPLCSDQYVTLRGPRHAPVLQQAGRWKYTPMGRDAGGQSWSTGPSSCSEREDAWYALPCSGTCPALQRWHQAHARQEHLPPGKEWGRDRLSCISGPARRDGSRLEGGNSTRMGLSSRRSEGFLRQRRGARRCPPAPAGSACCPTAYAQRLREVAWWDPVVPAQYLGPSTRWGAFLWQEKPTRGKEYVATRHQSPRELGGSLGYVPGLSFCHPPFTTQDVCTWSHLCHPPVTTQ
ncbi:tektin bundle-interacting protein 1 [Dromaius novaehollandiae]|uniref:tektin bundle-interacting protein 1 n=1 Tax=Dromaius novaehollandiae TaxID=8790 RepID=UPI00311E3FB8